MIKLDIMSRNELICKAWSNLLYNNMFVMMNGKATKMHESPVK